MEMQALILARLNLTPLNWQELRGDFGQRVKPDVIKDALDGLLEQGQVRSYQRAGEEFFSVADYEEIGLETGGWLYQQRSYDQLYMRVDTLLED
jgi:hypothetical protein